MCGSGKLKSLELQNKELEETVSPITLVPVFNIIVPGIDLNAAVVA